MFTHYKVMSIERARTQYYYICVLEARKRSNSHWKKIQKWLIEIKKPSHEMSRKAYKLNNHKLPITSKWLVQI